MAPIDKRIRRVKRRIDQKPGRNEQLRGRLRDLRHRRSRLSMPAPNADPQAPGGPLPGPSRGLRRTGATQTANRSPAPPLSRELQGFSTYRPAPGVPDPRDERYWADLAKGMFEKNQQLAQLNTEGTYGRTAYEAAVQNLARSQPIEERQILESANQAGAFYSTATSNDIGQLAQQYQQQRASMGSEFQRENALRALTRSAIEQGFTVEEAGMLAEAIDRQSSTELDRPPPPGGPGFKVNVKVSGKGGKKGGGKKGGKGDKQLQQLRNRMRNATGAERTRLRRRYRRLKNRRNNA